MQGIRILGVYRESVFSPGKVGEDAAILDATIKELSRYGFETSSVRAEVLEVDFPEAELVLSMAQSERALQIMEYRQKSGARIVNSVMSVRNCYRKPLIELLSKAALPVPASRIVSLDEVEGQMGSGTNGSYWVKRGDVHAMEAGDVVRVASGKDLVRALDHFRKRGIRELLIQEHVEGRTIKFYGVGAEKYFKAFFSSSGEETTSQRKELIGMAQRSAGILGLEIYGGDAILTGEGNLVLVDLNDWPSFALCRPSAAKGIAGYVLGFLKLDAHRPLEF
jgi:hypothetical protein